MRPRRRPCGIIHDRDLTCCRRSGRAAPSRWGCHAEARTAACRTASDTRDIRTPAEEPTRMTTLLPLGAKLTPYRDQLRELNSSAPSETWFADAMKTLRGGDGGEHGQLLYGLVRRLRRQPSVAILDVGTARGFSAISMARALLDGGLEHRVVSIDVIGHDEPTDWHSRRKHDPADPLAGRAVSRAEIWRYYPDEAACIRALQGRSRDVLENWTFGPVGLAFIDGEHTYRSVKNDLESLERLMAPGAAIVLDDVHPGVIVGSLRSRLVNGAVRRIGSVLTRWSTAFHKLRIGADNEYLAVSRRFSGVYRAVSEFWLERESEWALEVISMPSRGDYHSADYSLAVLARKGTDRRE